MGTRANIILFNWESAETEMIYRHYDGYPAELGADLIKLSRECDNISDFKDKLLKITESDGETLVYEIVDGMSSDTEHLYAVWHTDDELTQKFSHAERTAFGKWTTISDYSLPEFVEFVNEKRKESNERGNNYKML